MLNKNFKAQYQSNDFYKIHHDYAPDT